MMQTRFLTPSLVSLLLAAPLACGDDKGGAETAATTAGITTVGAPRTTISETPTTTGEDLTTTGETPPTTTTEGPTTTTGDDSTTGQPIGCQAPADDGDEDLDGVANGVDNCRC